MSLPRVSRKAFLRIFFCIETTRNSPSGLLLSPLLAEDFFEPFLEAQATTVRRATDRFVVMEVEAGALREFRITAGATARAAIRERIAERQRHTERSGDARRASWRGRKRTALRRRVGIALKRGRTCDASRGATSSVFFLSSTSTRGRHRRHLNLDPPHLSLSL